MIIVLGGNRLKVRYSVNMLNYSNLILSIVDVTKFDKRFYLRNQTNVDYRQNENTKTFKFIQKIKNYKAILILVIYC